MGHFTTTGQHYVLGDILHAVKPIEAINGESSDEEMQIALPEVPSERAVVHHEVGTTQDMDGMSSWEVVSTGDAFIHGLGEVLSRWVEQAGVSQGKGKPLSPFQSIKAPPISISDYLMRIRKYFFCSDECFVIALVYIDRMSKKCPSLAVCDLTVHRLLVITVIIAAKYHDDMYYSNQYYAKVGGLSLKEVNALEAKMLKVLDWSMHVSGQEYQLYHNLLCQSVQ